MPRPTPSSNEIRGNNRDDVLFDTVGDDVIDGRRGNDILIHSGGNDTMTGGEGDDVFVFAPTGGTVTITDFEDGADQIDLTAFGFDQNGQSATYAGYLESHGTDTHIVFYDLSGEALRIVLEDTSHTVIDPSDYIL